MNTRLFSPTLLSLGLAVTLTGCASVASDGGVNTLQQRMADLPTQGVKASSISIAIPRPGQDNSAEITQLLKGPLSADAAVRVALLNNPRLQVALGSEGVNISDLSPAQHPAKLRASQQITRLSTETRKAWLHAVSAAQAVDALTQAQDAAEVSGDLARRLTQAGNWSRLQQARQQVHLVEAATELARAQQAAFSAREKLTVLLGLWGTAAQFELPTQLPALPAKPLELPDVEARALKAHEDLRIAVLLWQRQEAERRLTQPGELWSAMGNAAQLRDTAVKIRSSARETYQRYRSFHDLARIQQDEMLPLRQFISDEMLLRYNGMLSSVFKVLEDSRLQARAHHSAIQATRDFWLAEADLQSLLSGTSKLDTAP
jgi:multidrug efflux system outer membrane protein